MLSKRIPNKVARASGDWHTFHLKLSACGPKEKQNIFCVANTAVWHRQQIIRENNARSCQVWHLRTSEVIHQEISARIDERQDKHSWAACLDSVVAHYTLKCPLSRQLATFRETKMCFVSPVTAASGRGLRIKRNWSWNWWLPSGWEHVWEPACLEAKPVTDNIIPLNNINAMDPDQK